MECCNWCLEETVSEDDVSVVLIREYEPDGPITWAWHRACYFEEVDHW